MAELDTNDERSIAFDSHMIREEDLEAGRLRLLWEDN